MQDKYSISLEKIIQEFSLEPIYLPLRSGGHSDFQPGTEPAGLSAFRFL